MRVWTTMQLSEPLLGNGFNAVVRSERVVKAAFLEEGKAGDAAVLPLDPDYRAFLADVRRRGLRGPVVFVSSGATDTEEHLSAQNALILNLDRIGIKEARAIVKMILSLSQEQSPADTLDMEPALACSERDAPEQSASVGELLLRVRSQNIPVVLAFQVFEDLRNTVTAQGTCFLKTFTPEAAVFWKFRPAALISSLKKDMDIELKFSIDGKTYQASVKIVSIGENEFVTALPAGLSPMTRRYSRVKPSARQPVLVYVLMPKLPTTLLNVKEISQRGIGFTAPDGLAVGAVTAFSVLLPEPVQETVLTAGIIRSKVETEGGFRYGAEFLVHPRDEEKIARYVMHREQEIMGLLRER